MELHHSGLMSLEKLVKSRVFRKFQDKIRPENSKQFGNNKMSDKHKR